MDSRKEGGRERGEGEGEGREGREGEGRGGRFVSARMHGHVRADVRCFTLGNFKKNTTVRPSYGRLRGHRPTVRLSENVRVTTLPH
jgi:hypothetical protein